MRQFDTLQSYMDNSGNVLIGKVVFCDTNGVPTIVHDKDGNNIDGGCVYTDSAGRLNTQVFLDDKDYLVKFYKYRGNTSMTDDYDDEDVWEWHGECLDLRPSVHVDGSSNTVISVSTMDDLRKTTPAEGVDDAMVNLIGYNKAGDKPIVSYRWDSDSVADDNGGSVVMVEGVVKGRWVIVDTGESVDVRHFGVFPNTIAIEDTDQRSRIRLAHQYASSNRKNLQFLVGGYFDISGITFSRKIYTSSESRLLCVAGKNASVNVLDQAYFYGDAENFSGIISVKGDVLRSAFNVYNTGNIVLKPSVRIILDKSAYANFSNIEVFLEKPLINGCDFDNCTFFGSEKIGGSKGEYKFENCRIEERFLDFEDYKSSFSFSNCTSSINDWSSTQNYVDYAIKNGDQFIDMNMGLYKGDLYFSKMVALRNGTIEGNVNTTSPINFDNVVVKSGVLHLSGPSGYVGDIILRESTVYIEGLGETLYSTNCTISGTGRFKNAVCSNTTFNCNLIIDLLKDKDGFYLNNCTFTGSYAVGVNGVQSKDPPYKISGNVVFCNTNANMLIYATYADISGIKETGTKVINSKSIKTSSISYDYNVGNVIVTDSNDDIPMPTNVPRYGSESVMERTVINSSLKAAPVVVGYFAYDDDQRKIWSLVPSHRSEKFYGQRMSYKKELYVDGKTQVCTCTLNWTSSLELKYDEDLKA